MGAPDLRARRQPSHDVEVAQRKLAHDAGEDDEREQHPEQEVKEVVARVDGGEADAEGNADEVLALAGELQTARRTQPTQPAQPGRKRAQA